MEDFNQFNNYNRINSAVGQLISSGPGRLGYINIHNAGTAWEVELFDGTSSAATTTIGVIKGATTPVRFEYDLPFRNGLYVNAEKGTAAGDLIITYK